jgi:hypothetical protein
VRVPVVVGYLVSVLVEKQAGSVDLYPGAGMPLNELAEAVASTAHALESPDRLDEVLTAILGASLDALKGFDHAGVLLSANGTVAARVATSDLAAGLDRAQVAEKQGPALEVIGGSSTLLVPDLRREERWSRYASVAARLGAVTQLSARLQFNRTATLGSLNLYATEEVVPEDEGESLAEVFAAQAAVAVGGATMVTGLTEGLESRKLIGQATGILMERFRIDETHAFAYLRRESSHRNVKLREIAAEVTQSISNPIRGA